jgi:hypothetical protein
VRTYFLHAGVALAAVYAAGILMQVFHPPTREHVNTGTRFHSGWVSSSAWGESALVDCAFDGTGIAYVMGSNERLDRIPTEYAYEVERFFRSDRAIGEGMVSFGLPFRSHRWAGTVGHGCTRSWTDARGRSRLLAMSPGIGIVGNAALLALLTSAGQVSMRRVRRFIRSRRGECEGCGYPRSAQMIRCPECGNFARSALPQPRLAARRR